MQPSKRGCRKDANMRRTGVETFAVICLLSVAFLATVTSAGNAEGPNAASSENPAVAASFEPPESCAAAGSPFRGPRVGAGGSPGRHIAPLLERADAIARGTVQSVQGIGNGVLTVEGSPDGFVAPVRFELSQVEPGPDQYAVTAYRAVFYVASVVKGSTMQAGSAIEVTFYLPYMGPIWAPLAAGQHGLLLLDAHGNLADLFYPLLPIAPGAPFVSSDLAPLEAVGEYFLLSFRPDTSPAVLQLCLDGTLDLGIAAEAIESLRSLAASEDPAVRGIALRGLVEIKDRKAVPEAVRYLLNNTAVPGLPEVPIRVGVAIGKLDDPSLAQAVVPLLSSANSVLRDDALQALRRMRNPAAIPALVGALADPDESIQYGAMMGIARTVGAASEWLPSRPHFDEAPRHYLDHWLNWWQTEGEALYGTTGQSPLPNG